MADKGDGGGFRGDRREGFGAGRDGRGTGRFDRGRGRFDRGAGRSDRGGGRFSWRRNSNDSTFTDNSGKSSRPSSSDTSRWDAAAATERQSSSEGGVWVEKAQKSAGSGEGNNTRAELNKGADPTGAQKVLQGAAKTQVPPANSGDPCIICKTVGHLPIHCPRAFCERCSKLGHLASACFEFLPWECIAPMCAFQGRGQGFYYIHDYCTARQANERSCFVLVTVLQGNPTAKMMNDVFFLYLGKTWRCSAKLIEPGVFLMRFPNTREVDKACYSDRMTMKPCGTVVKVTRWDQNGGAKGLMEKAWVKVGNIPADKRCERNVAFVASLVGVPLEIDVATLHRPESVKVKLGCRNVDEIPQVAESVLGDHFYEFTYEVEHVLVRDPDREKNKNKVGEDHGEPTPKKQKKSGVDEDPMGSSSNDKIEQKGKETGGKQHMSALPESPISMNSDSSNHNTLLIHSMEQEALAAASDGGAGDVSTPLVTHFVIESDSAGSLNKMGTNSYADVVKKSIQVTEMVGPFEKNEECAVPYSVQSPDSAFDHYEDVVPTPPLLPENVVRFSMRSMHNNLEKIEDKARAAGKKRDLEGLLKGVDRTDLERGAELLKENARSMMRLCATAHSDGDKQ